MKKKTKIDRKELGVEVGFMSIFKMRQIIVEECENWENKKTMAN